MNVQRFWVLVLLISLAIASGFSIVPGSAAPPAENHPALSRMGEPGAYQVTPRCRGEAGLAPAWERLLSLTGHGYGTDIQLSSRVAQPAAGLLTFVEAQYDGVGGVDGLDEATRVAVSPDGSHVYVTGWDDDAVAVFDVLRRFSFWSDRCRASSINEIALLQAAHLLIRKERKDERPNKEELDHEFACKSISSVDVGTGSRGDAHILQR